MERYESLSIDIEVISESMTLPVRQIVSLQPGSILPWPRPKDGLVAFTAGGFLLGYGRLEEDMGPQLRVVSLSENL